MPVIVDKGFGEFKYIEDGRTPDAPANYTYVDAKDWPAGKQYMLDPNFDTTAPSASAPPQQGGSSGGSGGSRSGGSSGGYARGTRAGGTVTPDVLRDGSQGRLGSSGEMAGGVPRTAKQSPTTFDPTTTPLVQLTGNSAWNEYTPPGETAPRVSGGAQPPWNALAGGAQSQEPSASFSPQVPRSWDYYTINPQPVGRPSTGDLLNQQYYEPSGAQRYDPTAGAKYPPGSPMYPRPWVGEYAPPVSFANNQPWQPSSGGNDFGRVDNAIEGITSGQFTPGIPSIPMYVPPYQEPAAPKPVTIVQANGQVLTRDPVTGMWR